MKIVIDITNNCNLRCTMCGSHDVHPRRDGVFIDAETYKQHITSDALHNAQYVQIGNAAEPLIHKDFDTILRHTRNVYAGKIIVLTNGTKVHEHAECLNTCADMVVVSVDTMDRDDFFRIRGVPLHKIKQNLKHLEAQRVNVLINMTVGANNIQNMQNMEHFCADNGYTLNFFPMWLRALGQSVLLYENCYNSLLFHTQKRNLLLKMASWNTPTQEECISSPRMFYIISDGTVKMCHHFDVGNILEHPLATILHSAPVSAYECSLRAQDSLCPARCSTRTRYDPTICDAYSFIDEHVLALLDQGAVAKLRFDAPLSDTDKLRFFLQTVSRSLSLWHTCRTPEGFRAMPLRREHCDALPLPSVLDEICMTAEGSLHAPTWFSLIHAMLALSQPAVACNTGGCVAKATPLLLGRDVLGHNLLSLGVWNNVYVIPTYEHLPETTPDALDALVRARRIGLAHSLTEARNMARERPYITPGSRPWPPSLLCEEAGHNLVRVGLPENIYVIPTYEVLPDITPDILDVLVHAQRIGLAHSLAEARSMARGRPHIAPGSRPWPPSLVGEEAGHNLVQVGLPDNIYVVPQRLGPVDLSPTTADALLAAGRVGLAPTLAQARTLACQMAGSTSPQKG